MTETVKVPAGFSAAKIIERGTENGVEWFTYPAPMFGAVNGYALLPEGHPWRDLDLQTSDYDKGPDVHGGITFGPKDGWVGFDTLHAGDSWPGSSDVFDGDRHWRPEEVAAEARHLACQISEASA
jgi:hypothetical protein